MIRRRRKRRERLNNKKLPRKLNEVGRHDANPRRNLPMISRNPKRKQTTKRLPKKRKNRLLSLKIPNPNKSLSKLPKTTS